MATRFMPSAPVRLAVVPASVPQNMSFFTNEQPGVGNKLAWSIHQEFLKSGAIPVVEVFNRHDWPRKKEEFFTGNFEAIRYAREANYDLVLIPFIEHQSQIDTVTAYVKVIEVETGLTIFYGKVNVSTMRKDFEDFFAPTGLTSREPAKIYQNELFNELSRCIVSDILEVKEMQ